MQYKLTQNIGTDDAKDFGIDSKQCSIGSVIELASETAELLAKKYPSLLEPVAAVKGVAKTPEIIAPAITPPRTETIAKPLSDEKRAK